MTSTLTPPRVAESTPPHSKGARPQAGAARRVRSISAGTAKRTVAVGAFLLLWQFAPQLGWVDRTFLPPFTEVVDALWGWPSRASSGRTFGRA